MASVKLFSIRLGVGECWNPSLVESSECGEEHVHGADPGIALWWGLFRLGGNAWMFVGGRLEVLYVPLVDKFN